MGFKNPWDRCSIWAMPQPRRAFYYPSLFANDLDANEKAEKTPGSDVGARKGIQATTYGYADLSRVPGEEADGVS
jgi:hypothetical protein